MFRVILPQCRAKRLGLGSRIWDIGFRGGAIVCFLDLGFGLCLSLGA